MPPFESDNDAQGNLPVPTRASRRNEPAFPAGPWNGETADVAPASASVSPVLSFHSLLKAFRHRWPLAVAVGLGLGLTLAAGMWFLLTAQYTAYALLRVASTEPRLLPEAGGASRDASQNFENTQVALLKSRPILQAALRRSKVGELAMVRKQIDPVAWLENDLKAAFLDRTDIIKVSLTGADPKEVAALVNAVKDAYLEEGVNAQRNQKLAFLEDLEKVYTASEDKLHAQRDALRNLADTLKSGDSQALTAKQKMALEEYAAMRRELMHLQSQLRNAELTLEVQKTSVVGGSGDSAATGAPDSAPVPDSLIDQAVDADPVVMRKKLEVDQAAERLAQAAHTYNPGKGTLPKYTAELEEIKKDLEKAKKERRSAAATQVTDRVRADQAARGGRLEENVAVWKREEAKLQTEVNRLGQEAQKIGITSFELELKRTEIDQAESVLKQLRDEKERLQVELQSNTKRVTVLSPAEVPQQQDGSTRTRGAAFAGVGGLLVGLFGVSFWEARGRRIRTKEEVANELGLRVVGTLPALSGRPELAPGRARPVGRGADPAAVWLASVDAIRAAVLCDAEDCPGARALLVTSALAREGKTTLACHLALSLARAGKRVLLVDCDSHRPRIHGVLGTPLAPGLAEALGAAAGEAAVHAGPVEGLSVLPIGGDATHVSQALARPAMRTFLEGARKVYDFVLLDCCPVLPVADALALGRLVDGVLLSVRPGVSQFPHVAAACERLAGLNIPMLGAVVNGTPLRTSAPEYEYLRHRRTLPTELIEG
jgi:polysaccharide biosynthesis transport protein